MSQINIPITIPSGLTPTPPTVTSELDNLIQQAAASYRRHVDEALLKWVGVASTPEAECWMDRLHDSGYRLEVQERNPRLTSFYDHLDDSIKISLESDIRFKLVPLRVGN